MPKPQPNREPDPMAGVVDRLLSQLPGLQGESPAPRGAPRQVVAGGTAVHYVQSIPEDDLIGPWGRVVLSLALGTMMAWWPYSRSCGFPLVGYLGAIATVVVAGSWAAVGAWRHRTSLAHIVSLIVVLYGILLGGAELLPRTGYAVDQATWQCGDAASEFTSVTT
jgi:hypothetical protein